MRIRKMRMLMLHRFMPVSMAMLRTVCDRHSVRMRMVLVFTVGMFVTMFQHFVRVWVLVPLHQMQANTHSHKQSGGDQGRCHRFT